MTDQESKSTSSKSGVEDIRRASQSTGWETMMRQQIPDFARIAIMVKAGVRGHIVVESESQGDILAALIGELTGFFAKRINPTSREYELYWDEFIVSQNRDSADVVAYLHAAITGREMRLIVEARLYPALRKEIANLREHRSVVLSRKGEHLTIDGQEHVVPEGSLGIAIFWENNPDTTALQRVASEY